VQPVFTFFFAKAKATDSAVYKAVANDEDANG
jgi:hypothetical protein